MVGRSHTHHPGVAGGRWKKKAPVTQKIFKPNLHWAKMPINGVMKRVRLCTKCLRTVRSNFKNKGTRGATSKLFHSQL
ncbi:bL28 family ribosomal protein [Patescibacteria group bacterium]|nr:bL28 family ribosomal protein [Patescibacteria group bacterium]MCL5010465.1 bL28 family ribosomal protein [Patescibacteria group bacterium]